MTFVVKFDIIMIQYNWQKIFKTADGRAVECWRIFKMLARNEIPRNKYDPIYYYSAMNFHGDSFLLREDALLYYSYKYSTYDLCVYLALASLRPLAEYRASGKLTLDLAHAPLDPRDYLKQTRLLQVKDQQIHFYYEEVPKQKEIN